MIAEPFTTVGRVVKTHGTKGEVSVKSYAETSFGSLEGLDVWFVPPPAELRTSRITSVRPGPKGPVVAFEGISDMNTASSLAGREVLVSTDKLPGDWTEEADVDDAVGMTVQDETRGNLGVIIEVIVTGANDVWVVDGPFGEVLIPVIEDVVLGYDEETDTAKVRLLDGLIDDEGDDRP